MYITRIALQNFRNIKYAELDFDRELNVLVGSNGQGKTNLCEAISVCLGHSFRKAKFSQYIPADNPKAEVCVKLWFRDDITERENLIEYTIRKNILSVTYNGIKMKDAAELYGVLKYVVFIPEHLSLIKGAPDIRRDYLDDVALMQTQTHLKKLSRYNKGLKQRNNILANSFNYGDPSQLRALIEPWNDVLAQEGVNVTYGRLKYFHFLKKCAADIYKELSNGAETLDMQYQSSIFKTESIDFSDVNKLYNEYINSLERHFDAELKMHYTLTGVHRDDIAFFINNLPAKDYASQGQTRSAALALKLSEAEIIRRKNKTSPVVILDDILSELDSARRNFVLQHIGNSQVFITCCNMDDLSALNRGKAWRAEKGEFFGI
ncbi:MAG: DNA replication/repair protein RecF [Oscillospiraceae bacterium]